MRGLFNDTYVILFSDFIYKNIMLLVLIWFEQIKAIFMSTHNIYFYSGVDKSILAAIWKLQKCLTVCL